MIQARFIVEAQGRPKSFVDQSLKKHVEKMKMMKEFEVYDIKWEPTEEVDGLFSALADVGVKAKDFEVFYAALMGFAPTAVVVEKPEKLEVELREIQNVTNDIVQLFHALAQANAEMKLRLQKK